MDPVTGFVRSILPLFRKYTDALLELRTKSTQIRTLLSEYPLDNCVVAFSYSPVSIAAALEHKTPCVEKRIAAMLKLQRAGWKIGLRFDPLIYEDNYQTNYHELFNKIFSVLDIKQLHSVSLGGFRIPRDYFKTMRRLYPDEILFASRLQDSAGMVKYKKMLADEMFQFCSRIILSHIPDHLFFHYESPSHDMGKLSA